MITMRVIIPSPIKNPSPFEIRRVMVGTEMTVVQATLSDMNGGHTDEIHQPIYGFRIQMAVWE